LIENGCKFFLPLYHTIFFVLRLPSKISVPKEISRLLIVETVIAGLVFLDMGIQLVIIDRMFNAKQSNRTKEHVEEEENLTRHEALPDNKEAQTGWEFKILRANGNAFGNRETLKRVCAEEKRTGWILLEKLDDRRLRFRRPIAARAKDRSAKINPYRSHYGLSPDVATFITVAVSMAVLAIPAYVGFAFATKLLGNFDAKAPQSKPVRELPKAKDDVVTKPAKNPTPSTLQKTTSN
jgi:hypothetical protein